MALCACGAGQILGRYRGTGIEMGLDGMDSVAVSADWGERVAAGYGLPVSALQEFFLDLSVTLTAGGRDIEFEDGRFLVTGATDFMHAMAVGAYRRFRGAGGNRTPVDALRIGGGGLRAVSGTRHDELLPVTSSACGWNVGVAHR